ncbi:MAG: nickel pincer cofactor biosynthesis protein LarB [Candidatus Riflebacteria bacterium]|nr:nickel pincer cofactor biosynthesis protein LarB [Candidatus Riflebacteria bacterium]
MSDLLRERIKHLLSGFQSQTIDAGSLEDELTALIGSELETSDALIDVGREARLGFGEAIYAAGKTPAQVVGIFQALRDTCGRALATRCSPETIAALRDGISDLGVDERARLVWFPGVHPSNSVGKVAVLAAGTSDLPIAEEAAGTLAFAGIGVERFFDVGIAGIHRLLGRIDKIRKADVVIVVAGMEGALPSVVGGLVGMPVIAVPTSVGYGASFQGLAALLAMLNGCSAGITVVNIDNGFGAAVAAARILKTISRSLS